MLGIWKDFNDLEESLSMPELTAILEASRAKEKREQKFLAALQGVDLDEDEKRLDTNAFEDLKARVFSGGAAINSKDVLSLQGINAEQAGFGIGAGLDYEVADDNFTWS